LILLALIILFLVHSALAHLVVILLDLDLLAFIFLSLFILLEILMQKYTLSSILI